VKDLIVSGDPVESDEKLRRAIWPEQLDDVGKPTTAAFSYRDMSLDVASLCLLSETKERFPRSFIAVLICRSFIELGYQPEHAPRDDNLAHAIVPGRLSKASTRKISNNVEELHKPLSSLAT